RGCACSQASCGAASRDEPGVARRCAPAPSPIRRRFSSLVFLLRGRGLGLSLLRGVALLEPPDAAGRVDQLLLPREERVAGRAYLDSQVLLRRTGREGVPARAMDHDLDVFGMNALLHGVIFLSWSTSYRHALSLLYQPSNHLRPRSGRQVRGA